MSSAQVLHNILEQSQWRPLHENQKLQLDNIHTILKYAYENVPFYHKYFQEHFGKHIEHESILNNITALPILSRHMIQDAEKEMISRNIPPEHGETRQLETSGSTGRKVSVLETG